MTFLLSEARAQAVGSATEKKVPSALEKLQVPWQVFNTVEWLLPVDYGEVTGEAEIIVFRPQHGLVVIEIKTGQVEIPEGVWYYGLGPPDGAGIHAKNRGYQLIFNIIYVMRQPVWQLSVMSVHTGKVATRLRPFCSVEWKLDWGMISP